MPHVVASVLKMLCQHHAWEAREPFYCLCLSWLTRRELASRTVRPEGPRPYPVSVVVMGKGSMQLLPRPQLQAIICCRPGLPSMGL